MGPSRALSAWKPLGPRRRGRPRYVEPAGQGRFRGCGPRRRAGSARRFFQVRGWSGPWASRRGSRRVGHRRSRTPPRSGRCSGWPPARPCVPPKQKLSKNTTAAAAHRSTPARYSNHFDAVPGNRDGNHMPATSISLKNCHESNDAILCTDAPSTLRIQSLSFCVMVRTQVPKSRQAITMASTANMLNIFANCCSSLYWRSKSSENNN